MLEARQQQKSEHPTKVSFTYTALLCKAHLTRCFLTPEMRVGMCDHYNVPLSRFPSRIQRQQKNVLEHFRLAALIVIPRNLLAYSSTYSQKSSRLLLQSIWTDPDIIIISSFLHTNHGSGQEERDTPYGVQCKE